MTAPTIAPSPPDAPAHLNPERIMQLGMGFWASKALLTAVELGVFTALTRGPADAQTLGQRVGIHPRGARDFFDALVSLGMLDREGEVYRNTPETAHFLDRGKPSYIGGLLEMANARLYESWGKLTQALRTGQNVSGMRTFEDIYRTPEELRGFLAAMTGVSLGTAQVIGRTFDWSRFQTFADIGCAQGALPVQLALMHPHLTGIGFDLPMVRPIFEEYVAAFGLQHRLRFVPGDLFKDPLPTADVLVMGHMLHGWGLEDKQRMLRKAYDALPPGGALIVYEALIDDERRKNTFGLLMSLNMLVETPEGFDYTGADAIRWMAATGFKDVQVVPLVGPDSMVVGMK
ncbi:MAG TPA: methyltransferase [bacterium]|nr:methyltransferase [bacterium]